MDRRAYLGTVGVAISTGLAGCTTVLGMFESDPCTGDDCDIGMTRNEFVPETYEITAGDTVRWKNTSGADHTVTAFEHTVPDDAAYFASGDYEDEATARDNWHTNRGGQITTRETYEHTFDVPGSYRYVCIPHERGGMVGTIEVTD